MKGRRTLRLLMAAAAVALSLTQPPPAPASLLYDVSPTHGPSGTELTIEGHFWPGTPIKTALYGGHVIASRKTPRTAYTIAAAGNYVYLSGFQVVDVSDPAHPEVVGTCDTPDFITDIAVAGNYAYAADLVASLHTLDVSDPTTPHIVGSCDLPEGPWDVSLTVSLACVAVGPA